MITKIIILTKSRKHSGLCVAGIDYETGKWIRLVSNDVSTEGAVPYSYLRYSDRSDVDIYDIVECDLLSPCPTPVQPENWYYNESFLLKKIGRSSLDEVLKIHGYDNPEFVFFDGNEKLPANFKFNYEGSLCLLKIENPYIWIKTFNGNQTVSLNFSYKGNDYNYLRISQFDVLEFYRDKRDNSYPLNSDSVVFSLTDKYYYTGKYYKVIAQILN